MIRPLITPSGRRLPLAAEEDSTIGNTGRTQGERTVTKPDNKENRIKISMIYLPWRVIFVHLLIKGHSFFSIFIFTIGLGMEK